MAQVVVMPQLGNTVESCLITTWLVAVGNTVEPNTLLCEIETDKSSMEVPAGVAGTVLALLAAEGDDVPVKEPIAVVGEPGEDISSLTTGPEELPTTIPEEPRQGASEASRSASGEPSGAALRDAGSFLAGSAGTGEGVSPRARGLAASQGIAAGKLAGTGPQGRVIERDVRAAMASGAALTPGARAEADGFVPGAPGTGIGGRVTRADLHTVPEEPGEFAGEVSRRAVAEFPGEVTETPLKGIRKVIAERMMNSLATSAQLTYTATAPAAGLLALRARLKGAADPELAAVTIGDLVGYATVKTLATHPVVNAHLTDGVLREFASIHLGMAVDTPRGLLVPTLRFADTLSLREFSAQSKALANEAIGGSINPDLLAGATFTVSNLGAFGIESFTPLLNVPQVAILGVDAIFPRAVINADGSVGAEQRIGFSLTADHRVIDGADAARYLKDLCRAVADIDLTVLG
ncbi:MAG: 2-oxo acid dehydrogenase subunit E2 [Actinobacteria bacterium]|nr:2-oxo acid dehydrogenase subunit E2 [Actinomycetota bacterium]